MVLGGDRGERVALIAVLLEVTLGDLAEHAGEAALDRALLLEVGGAEQRLGDLGPGQVGHLLDAHHQDETRPARADRLQALVDRGRAGGAGILDAGRRLKRQASPACSTSELVKPCGLKPPP